MEFTLQGDISTRLQTLPKKAEQDVTDDRGDQGDAKIARRENIFDCPS